MPGGPSIPIALANPVSASVLVVQAGVTQMPEEAAGVKIPTIQGLAGWDLVETSGSATARYRLWDGTGAGGSNIELADIQIVQGGQSTAPPSNPVEVVNGAVYLERIAGSISGVIYILL
jgi:hypothetical protein